MLDTVQCPDVVIPNGTAVSQAVRSDRVYGDAETITLFGKNPTDGALTYTLEITDDPDRVGGAEFVTFQNETPANILPPLQGIARTYETLAAAKAFRIKASGNVTADRTWRMNKQTFI